MPRRSGVRVIRRFAAIAPIALLAGCASDTAAQKELSELRSEIRALRASNERLEQRVQRLEHDQIILQSARAPKADARSSTEKEQPWKGTSVPELTVVKLKPRAQAAPPIATDTEVQEPTGAELESLLADSSERLASDDADPAEDATPTDPNGADAAFEQAMAPLKTGNISGAVLQLQTFAQKYPRHARSDNALYFSGVGLMALEDYQGAANAFERVLNEYPAGDARIDALLKLADCRVKLNQKDDARSLYARLISTYPGTAAAHLAQQRLAQITQ